MMSIANLVANMKLSLVSITGINLIKMLNNSDEMLHSLGNSFICSQGHLVKVMAEDIGKEIDKLYFRKVT